MLDVGNIISYKREDYEIIEEVFIHTTKKLYYKLKKVGIDTSYRLILKSELEDNAKLQRTRSNYYVSESVCTCGAKKVFGKQEAKTLHAEYCDCNISKYN